jgi:hypothetical protein
VAARKPPSLISQAPAPAAPAVSPAASAASPSPVAEASEVVGGLPTIAELVASGDTEAEAYAELVEEMARQCGKPEAEAQELSGQVKSAFISKTVSGIKGSAVEPYFRCQALTPRGEFWAIGRKFTSDPKNPGNKVLMKDLDDKTKARLEKANPKFLAVIPVYFE